MNSHRFELGLLAIAVIVVAILFASTCNGCRHHTEDPAITTAHHNADSIAQQVVFTERRIAKMNDSIELYKKMARSFAQDAQDAHAKVQRIISYREKLVHDTAYIAADRELLIDQTDAMGSENLIQDSLISEQGHIISHLTAQSSAKDTVIQMLGAVGINRLAEASGLRKALKQQKRRATLRTIGYALGGLGTGFVAGSLVGVLSKK